MDRVYEDRKKKCLQDLGVICSLYMAVDCKPQVFKKLVSKLEETIVDDCFVILLHNKTCDSY